MPTLSCCLRCGDLSSPGVTERRNGPLGLRDDDGDEQEELHYSSDTFSAKQ